MNHKPPQVCAAGFTCPHCNFFANQKWVTFDGQGALPRGVASIRIVSVRKAVCDHCNRFSLWVDDQIVYPRVSSAPLAHEDMPPEVKVYYLEAGGIFDTSPRAAAALLRLALQILCKELGEKGENINNDIGELVKKGLPVIVQRQLDILRVTGNAAVHPGTIDVDSRDVVVQLFCILNDLIERLISRPRRDQALYDTLPPSALKSIDDRDAKTTGEP